MALNHPSLSEEDLKLLRRRLLGLMVGRLIFSILLMGMIVVYQGAYRTESHYSQNFIFWLVGINFFLTLNYSYFFARVKRYQMFSAVQLGGDLVVLSLLVLATGCQDSLFLFCYLLLIIAACTLFPRREVFRFTVHSFLFLAIVLFGSYLGYFQDLFFIQKPAPLKLPELAYVLLLYGVSFYLVALLGSHLVEQLRHTKEIMQQQEIELGNLEAKQRDIVMSLNSGLITTNTEGVIEFFNPRAKKLLNLQSQELGRPLHELFPGFDLSKMREVVEQNQRLELTSPRANKEASMCLGLSLSVLRERQGKECGFLLLFQDLTPLKQIEEVARRHEKMAALGEITAGLAHEIRNPLSSLSGSIQLLQGGLSLSGEEQLLMEIVLRETERLDRLLSEFLLFARPRRSKIVRHKASDLLQKSLFLFSQDARYTNVEVEYKIVEPCPLEVDEQLFQQVLWNLLSNAAQAMQPEGGKISITAVLKDSQTCVRVVDQGPGVPASMKERIFDPFFSTKENGTDLRFNVSKAHYFRYIYAQTGSGSGSTFTATANADLDCDGVLSTYQYFSTVDTASGEVGRSELITTNALE